MAKRTPPEGEPRISLETMESMGVPGAPKEVVHPEPSSIEKAKEALTRKAHRFHRLFATPLGKEVLQDLEDQFNKDELFKPGDPHATSYNCGARDVVIYINQMIRLEERNARSR